MSRRLALLACLLVVGTSCATTPAPPPPTPPPAPPPEGRELESPVAPERAEELRREAAAALQETEAILARLEAATRREHRDAVTTIEGLAADSRAALAEGDVEQAANLARKALELARAL